MQNLTNKIQTIIAHAPVAAGTSNITDCVVIDTQGYEGLRFIVGFGTITSSAVTSLKAQQSEVKASATSLTNGADLAGTGITVADTDDNKIFIMDIYRPAERYVQLFINRGIANAVVDFAIAELYGARKLPVPASSDVAQQELNVSPAEGTA